MSQGTIIQVFLIFGPVLALLVVGAAIALRSGTGELQTGRDYVMIAGNFSQMLLRIACYVVALMLVQYMIGLRPSLGW